MADSSLRNKDFEDTIEIKKWETSILGKSISLWVIKVKGEFYFFGKEVAEALGYKNPREAILDHVDQEERKTIEEVLGTNYKRILERKKSTGSVLLPVDFIQKIKSNQKLITEVGLISFCTDSRMRKAKPFQKWVYKTIQKIRKTGFYVLPGGAVDNPLDLVEKVYNLEKEIETFKKEAKRTCDKETQTQKSVIVLDGSFKDLEERIVKFFKKTKSSFKKTIEEAKFDLEETIKEARLDLEKSIEGARLNLEKSIRKISSSSSSSGHHLYYSSDSE